jgi:alkylated DNA repair dioxygenase AlkB/23S rRNA U2552 (ribose-2'-O)-methylase RlmE/FtsJ
MQYGPMLYPYERANRSIFSTRAALKLANIDADFNICGNTVGFLHKRLEGNFTFCDVAGGPGSFTQYIHYRRSESMGFGITKKSHINWDLSKIEANRFIPIYGEDGSGDLYTQWDSFMNTVRYQTKEGVDLVVADGGLDEEEFEDDFRRRQETITSHLIASEVYLGIALTKHGGDFVVKTFDTVTKLTADLIYCCALAFDSISLFKPVTSRPFNAEQYLVCKGRKELDQETGKFIDTTLRNALTNWKDSDSLFGALPTNFTTWLTNVNNQSIENRIKYTKAMIEIVNSGHTDMHVDTINLHRLLVVLNLPGERYKKTINQRPNNVDTSSTTGLRDDLISKLRNMEFPFISKFSIEPATMFSNLVNYIPKPIHDGYELDHFFSVDLPNGPMFRDGYIYFRSTDRDNIDIDDLTNYFTEQERIKSRKIFGIPEKDVLKDEKYLNTVADSILSENKVIPSGNDFLKLVRSAIYRSVSGPTTFRLTWAKSILTTITGDLKDKLILDISSGWGDRLITAIALGARYLGFDPNINLKSGHDRIIEMFGDPQKHKVVYTPFEDGDLSSVNGKVDIVFTSPPFFNLELYTDDPTQSVLRYPTIDGWINGFFYPALRKSWDALKSGGYMAIHISDIMGKERIGLCKYLYDYINSIKGSEFEGIIGVSGIGSKISPTWVWRKTTLNTVEDELPGFRYMTNIITEPVESKILDFLSKQKWSAVGSGKSSREVIQYGYAYNYTAKNPGEKVEPIPNELSPFVDILSKAVPDQKFNQCIVNKYLPGQGISAHIDHTKFGPVIACFSIGSYTVVDFALGDADIPKFVDRRSLYIMAGDSRYKWKHSIAARKSDTVNGKKMMRGERISITFRTQ